MKQKILIAGLGLIGGSILRAIRTSGNYTLLGYDIDQTVLDYCQKEQLTDEVYTSFHEAAIQADIIILAAPITTSIGLLKELDTIEFDHEVIVSDVSSVKGTIFEAADQLTNPNVVFIGGHPMAGSHKTGIEASKEHLFENAIYVLTPANECNKKKLEALKAALQWTKCRFLILTPDEHDELTSVISHFPHLNASSLVHQARKWEQVHTYLPELAAGGFRDITRIASSNPKLWQDIFHHNGKKMSRLLQDWINEMVTLKEFLDKNSDTEMVHYLKEAKDYRDGLNKSARGALPSYYDLYVDIKDKPGAIASVVQLLAEANISIRNIRILEIRDSINGAPRLSVTTKEDQKKAFALLSSQYEVTLEV